MALSTSTTARWTILSSNAAIPSGRCRPSALPDIRPPRWPRPVTAAVDPCMQVPQVRPQVLLIGPPRHLVHSRRGLRADRRKSPPQTTQIDVMQQRREPRLPVLSCNLAHTIQRTGRALPGPVSGTRFAGRVPLGRPSFLPHLRSHPRGVVRQVRRYYGAVRLPTLVHPRRTVTDVPWTTRPMINKPGERGTSRFSRMKTDVHALDL